MATGSIVKRGSKYSVVFYDQEGKQRWRTVGPVKKEAEKALRVLMGQVDHREYQDQDRTFSELVDAWLDSLRAQVKQSTLDGYQSICDIHLKPFFGSRRVRDIGTADIEAYLASKLGGKLGNRTVGYHLGVIKMLLKKAVMWNFAHKNVAEYVKRPKAVKKDITILSAEEVERLLRAATGQTRLVTLTGVLAGVRAGEICALRWSDVDLVTGVISIKQNYVRGRIETPKSRASIREIIIPPALVDALAKHKDTATGELVFPNGAGKPMDWNNFLHYSWAPLLKAARVPKVKFHSLRHNYVSVMLAAGEGLPFIQRQVGHSNLSVTLDVYSHLLPNKDVGAGERIGAAFATYVSDR